MNRTLVASLTLSAKDQRWTQVCSVRDMTQDEIDTRNASQAASVRAERNQNLADAPVDQAAWAAYRQALRDISAQEGFPWSVEWPTQP